MTGPKTSLEILILYLVLASVNYQGAAVITFDMSSLRNPRFTGDYSVVKGLQLIFF